jgi:beta-glucanase (GH16 family)
MEWTTNSIKMFVDGKVYGVVNTWYTAGGTYPAPYDQPFHILMNVAVGGNYVGNPTTNVINANTVFPGEMQVDYVRVYDYSPEPVPGVKITQATASGGYLSLSGSNGPPKATYYLLEAVSPDQSLNSWRQLATNKFDSLGGFSNRVGITSAAGLYRLQVP